jgi:polar amino acid transport system substrate-binding protein
MTVLFLVVTVSITCHAGDLQILGEESPPGEYLDENGNPAGVTNDLVKELLRRQDLQADIRILPWNRACHMGLTGRNIALMETTRTVAREDLFKWVGPILVVKRIIYARSGHSDTIEKIADLQRAETICVLRGSSNHSHLRDLGLNQIYPVAKPSLCLKMLLADRLTLFYTSEIGMEGLLQEQNVSSDSVKATLHLKKEYRYLAFSRDVSDRRIASWQKSLDEAKADGTVTAIYQGVYSDKIIQEVCIPGDPLAR